MLGRRTWLYDVLVPLTVVAAAPVLLARSLRRPEYRAHLTERLGSLPRTLCDRLEALPSRPLWIHAVSVGEVMLARTLVAALSPRPMVVSSTTPAGRDTAAGMSTEGLVGTFHPPLDWSPLVRRTLGAVRPDALVCVETEIWPALFAACGEWNIPLAIVNGRVSERSRGRYRRFAGWLRSPLAAVRLACMQSDEDADRIRSIGVSAERVFVTGNMKFDMATPATPGDQVRERFGLDPAAGPVLVAGSTSPGEERMILDAIRDPRLAGVRLILAPRHRERFDEVAALLRDAGMSFRRHSENGSTAPDGVRVLLLDTLGDLTTAYGAGDVAFVGGSLVPRGGQNMIEPAAWGVVSVFGPHTQNFSFVSEELIEAGAAFRVSGPEELTGTLASLFADEPLRKKSGAAGRSLIESHRGATGRTLARLHALIG